MWNNYEKTLGSAPYAGRLKFGTRKQDNLDLRFIKGKSGLPVSLKASNFDAQAELRDVGGFSDIQNEMPFYREGYMVTEKEEQEYANYQNAENSNLANQVLREISKKPMNLIEGALTVPERQIWSLLAPVDGVPKIDVHIGKSHFTVDYTSDDGAEHKKDHFIEIKTATDKWDAPTTAKPLDDLIQAKRTFAKKTGYSLAIFTMNTETFEKLLEAEDTKKQVLGIAAYQGGIRVQQGQVVDYLKGYGIEIEVYDKLYIDPADGQTKYFVPTGVICAQSGGVYLGDYVFGRTPEERSGSLTDGNLSIVETGIAVYTYATNHPINTHCVVSMIGLPTFEGMDSVVVMKVM
uniref:Major capsid protein n=1 Tax=virus sp. ctLTC15 TaxID=2826801 RepID=A0A8S5R7U7_9VIRU|nr:MAG TPA: major capsid protein [virus sp. ctLTC15]